ncbi:transcriptional repressor NF-X1 [Galdieria sulphuraria]|uniref:Transcriptional repressor NF-X1 n=1 Tax=Galdieria sulphuraria TaxID=130081 RepID=M2XWU8_GALSU|nr:transcriptional repressor NF-X1 [Galdieria sulphuraria]EME27889.1 transcriptional repressor NF-X1 [Galdieria sulphuraria]|eukprot:XP_005704409.1 transcriptional repressor NF-X1 [Galdieria sulphuraria]
MRFQQRSTQQKTRSGRKLEWKPVVRDRVAAANKEETSLSSGSQGSSFQQRKNERLPRQQLRHPETKVKHNKAHKSSIGGDSKEGILALNGKRRSATANVGKRRSNVGQKNGLEGENRGRYDNFAEESLRDSLKQSLWRETYECMVCYEDIQRSTSTWMCDTCFVVLHLSCVLKWSKSSQEQKNNQQHHSSSKVAHWLCPACRKNYTQVSLEYFCFCGKQKEPHLEPGIVPHSCGNICGKSLAKKGSNCPHTCLELCHPGPCPPCSALREPKSCRCGKEQIVRRCSEPFPEEGYSCGLTCGRLMECGHYCEQVCHKGACEPCQVPVETSCYCKSENSIFPCYLLNMDCKGGGFSCGRKCSQVLDCGNHHCEQICHPGPCESCKYLPCNWKTCACGKVSLEHLGNLVSAERHSCLDALPSCGQNCGKTLNCLLGHVCQRVCGHLDPCGPCTYEVELPCRCQNETIQVACSDSKETLLQQLACNRICGGRLSCKRHYCKRVCCPGNKKKTKKGIEQLCPSLEQKEKIVEYLGDFWNCFSHTCEQKCNQLLNCGYHYCDLRCGHEGQCYPCGILLWEPLTCACGAERIIPPFRCGTPPPVCNRPCQRVRSCGHPCPDRCHFGECPRCVVLMKKECLGGHGISITIPCFVEQVFCGRVCGKILKCGIHTCKRNCHADKCDDAAVEEEGVGCSNVCKLPRKACGHPCRSKCHPGTPCPNIPCEHLVTVTCPCGMKREEGICGQLDTENDVAIKEQNEYVRLECDESCSRLNRAREFADAVGILLPCMEEKKQTLMNSDISYSDFLIEFCEENMEFVLSFEQSLRELLQGRFGRRMKTQPLPRLYRAFVHELGKMFGLETASVDNYPEKEMVVSLPKDMENISIPSRLLTDVVKERIQRAKQERQDRTKRRLRIELIGEKQVEVGTRKLERLLLAHQGTYKILTSRPLERTLEFDVEFSTAERTASVLRSLEHKKPTVVAHPFTVDA